jgi:MFS family permease
MTARNGSVERHGSAESDSKTVTLGDGVREWWTLVTVCVGTFMLLLDITIVNVALPRIQAGLGSSFTDLQWVVDAYALTLAALLLTSGSLADLLGRRRIFAIGLVIFSAASLLSGVAQSPLMLTLSRGVQGIGGAMMFASSLALLGNAYRGRDRGVAFGVWGAVTVRRCRSARSSAVRSPTG